MALDSAESFDLQTSDHVVVVRRMVRQRAVELGFSLVDQTKIVTAASELARNVIQHGGGGRATLEVVSRNGRSGIRLIFEDSGPGIPDVARAMVDGFSTGGGLGLGLSGSKRLSHEFEIDTEYGRGTRVQIIRWK